MSGFGQSHGLTILCGCSFLVCPCRQTQQQLFSSFRASVNHIPPVPINYCLHPKHLPKRYPLKKYSLGVAQVSCWNTGERVGKAVLSLKNPIQNLSYLLDNAQLNFPLLENVGFYYFKQTEDLHTKQELSKCMQKKLKLPCFWQLFKKVKKKKAMLILGTDMQCSPGTIPYLLPQCLLPSVSYPLKQLK